MNGLKLLGRLKGGTVPLVNFDPQYRGIMDAMGYGNEGARQIGRASLRQMSEETIAEFLHQIERVLKPRGHCILWMDKFSFGQALHKEWLSPSPSLQLVDFVFWDKGRIGMGKRTRYRTEIATILQKKPIRAKGCWHGHSLGDNWTEMSDRSIHPHAKPIALQAELIKSMTKRGDLVVDPAAGGYTMLEACRVTGRNFLGCDLA